VLYAVGVTRNGVTMSIDLTLIQNLLDTHYGIGADKRMLLAHIDAYERLVPALIAELERINAELLSAQDGYAEMAFQNSLTP